MIRRKQQIKTTIAKTKEILDEVIDQGLEFEKQNEKQITSLKKRLQELSSETSYEETYQGKIEEIESIGFETVTLLLKKLSEITGNEYSFGRRGR